MNSLKSILLLVLMAGILPPGGVSAAQDQCGVLVISGRVKAGGGLTDNQLLGMALASGSREAVYFECSGGPDAEFGRTLLANGSTSITNPGFRTNLRPVLGGAIKAGVPTGRSGGRLTLTQKIGQGEVTFAVADQAGPGSLYAVMSYGAIIVTATVSEFTGPNGERWPELIRINTETGDSIIQYYDYSKSLPPYVPPAPPEPVSADGPPTPPELEGWGELDDVAFAGNWTNFSFDFDTGYWPHGAQNTPGGFPIQVRLDVGAGFDVNASVNGRFKLDADGNLAPEKASGTWGFDFGAELDTEACFDITVIDPICVEIPYIPNFDYRARAQGEFDSYLLDSKVELADNIDGGTLLDQSIGGLPGVVEARIKLDAYGSVSGSMTCPSITTDDGLTFDAEGQKHGINAAGGYSSLASYNEAIRLCGNLHLVPKIKLDFLGGILSWEIPTIEIPIPVICGPLDLDLGTSEISFDGPPVIQIPLRAQGDFDTSGCADVLDFLYLLDNWQNVIDGEALGIRDFLSLLDNWRTGPGCEGR